MSLVLINKSAAKGRGFAVGQPGSEACVLSCRCHHPSPIRPVTRYLLCSFVFSRRHQGHRLSINQDVHETPQHRVQAQAVHHVRHPLGLGRRDRCAVLRGTSSLGLVCLLKGQKGLAPCCPSTSMLSSLLSNVPLITTTTIIQHGLDMH